MTNKIAVVAQPGKASDSYVRFLANRNIRGSRVQIPTTAPIFLFFNTLIEDSFFLKYLSWIGDTLLK